MVLREIKEEIKMGKMMQIYDTREEYLQAVASEVDTWYWQLVEIIDELRAEFGIEQELCDIMERTPLEEKLYQEFDLPAYTLYDTFATGSDEWLELIEEYDEENEEENEE